MFIKQLAKPILSMLSTLVMCCILSACQNSRASTKSMETANNQHHHSVKNYNDGDVQICGEDEDRHYRINGKEFDYKDLNPEQKKALAKINARLAELEESIELESAEIDKWAEKMDKVAEKMDAEAEKFDSLMESYEVDENSQGSQTGLKEFSQKMKTAGQKLEAKMSALEKQMKLFQVKMPEIDHAKIAQIEQEAESLKKLLIEISKSI